ncbi:hypothetical protein [Cellulomonas marina]|uniref:Uncharacterized protein n=1 Tax=Cellulomonas marina TaxID=988821 RepID=A0A1I0X9G2_9CELL|nr:hypothetical protein [Cellulomonas marina]GIG29471.1 hypothetical protein Cma02nite_20710 [Cellulomonas marina]SFA96603.1 hypothetical protein SAMN05421867_104166 [Cellulomonas marina]
MTTRTHLRSSTGATAARRTRRTARRTAAAGLAAGLLLGLAPVAAQAAPSAGTSSGSSAAATPLTTHGSLAQDGFAGPRPVTSVTIRRDLTDEYDVEWNGYVADAKVRVRCTPQDGTFVAVDLRVGSAAAVVDAHTWPGTVVACTGRTQTVTVRVWSRLPGGYHGDALVAGTYAASATMTRYDGYDPFSGPSEVLAQVRTTARMS